MSKQQRTSGKDFAPLVIDGKTYTIRPLTIGDYGDMEAYIVSLQDDPFDVASAATKKMPSKHHAAIWDAALRQAMNARIVPAKSSAQFERSIDGVAWKLWKCLEQNHPEINSPEAAKKLLSKAGKDRLPEIIKRLGLGSGEAELGN